MNDPFLDSAGANLQAIRRRGWIIAAVMLALALAYTFSGPPLERVEFRAAMAALAIAYVVALFLSVEALYERKYLLFAFLVFVSMPSLGFAHRSYLEMLTGISVPSKWPAPISNFSTTLAIVFVVAFGIGLLIVFLLPDKWIKQPPPNS